MPEMESQLPTRPASVLPEPVSEGSRILFLADRRYSRIWIRRCAEHIIVLNDRTIERRVDLFLDFSHLDEDQRPKAQDGIVRIPIDRLPRANHAVTSVSADGAGELSRPTMQEERNLVLDAMTSAWGGKMGNSLPSDFKKIITSPVSIPPALARMRISWKSPKEEVFEFVRDLGANLSDVDEADLLGDLVRWKNNYLLLVDLPTKCIIGDQAVVHLSHRESIPGPQVIQGGHFSFRTALLQLTKLLGGTVSWACRIPCRPHVGPAESTHISVDAPEGFVVIDACVKVGYQKSDGETKTITIRDDDKLTSGAHVHLENNKLKVKDANFVLNFYSQKTGFFLETLISSWILWIIMQVFYDRLASVDFHEKMSGFDSALAAALILLLPATVITIVTQRDIHRVASRSYSLLRFLLSLSAVATIAGAAMLAMNVNRNTAEWGWTVSLTVAQVVAARLTLGAILHVYRTSRLREWVWRNYWFILDRREKSQLYSAPVGGKEG